MSRIKIETSQSVWPLFKPKCRQSIQCKTLTLESSKNEIAKKSGAVEYNNLVAKILYEGEGITFYEVT